jgi:hypothetical protein
MLTIGLILLINGVSVIILTVSGVIPNTPLAFTDKNLDCARAVENIYRAAVNCGYAVGR